jgi:photosystem II stability/assembly factor-like uncharacterized protein
MMSNTDFSADAKVQKRPMPTLEVFRKQLLRWTSRRSWHALLMAVLVCGCARSYAYAENPKGAQSFDNIYSVAPLAPGRWLAVGSKGLVLESSDDGETWRRRVLPERSNQRVDVFQDWDLYSVRFTPDLKAGWLSGEKGLIFFSDDRGATWKPRPAPTADNNIFRVSPADASTATAAGTDGTLLYTADAGGHWATQKQDSNVDFYDVTFIGDQGWAVGGYGTILHSSDGGQSWKIQEGGTSLGRGLDEESFFSVAFADDQRGRVAGLAGKLLVTDDGGTTWRDAGDGKLPSLFTTAGVAPAVWVAGKHGAILERINDHNWRTVEVAGARDDITDLAFSGKTGIAVGLQGVILRTADGGKTWASVGAQ